MISEGLIDWEQHGLAASIGEIGIGRDVERRNSGIAVRVGVIHHETAVAGVCWIERNAEQSLLGAGAHVCADVEKGPAQEGSILDDPDPSTLLDHEEAGITRRGGQVERKLKSGRDRLERHVTRGVRAARAATGGRIGAGHQSCEKNG